MVNDKEIVGKAVELLLDSGVTPYEIILALQSVSDDLVKSMEKTVDLKEEIKRKAKNG